MTIHEVVASNIITVGDLTLDESKQVATTSKGNIKLTPTQFKVMVHLAHNQDRVISHEELISALNTQGSRPKRTLMVHLCTMKRRLKDSGVAGFTISNIKGQGYRMDVGT